MSAADILTAPPAGDTPPATPPAGDTPPASPPSGDKPWNDFGDQELNGYAANKGWKDPKDLLIGYKNLEKLVGQDKIPLPKDPADTEGWNKVWDKLGRPQDPKEYGLKGDGEFAQEAAKIFHANGITTKQASAIAEFYNQYAENITKASDAAFLQQSEKDITDLKVEWAGNYEPNIEIARRATREFGIDGETVSKIERALGTKELFKFFNKIGSRVMESPFKEGTPSSSFGMDKNAALARIAELKKDAGWVKRYTTGDIEAKQEMERLQRLSVA